MSTHAFEHFTPLPLQHLPCFTITNLQEKLKESEIPQSHTYKSYKHSTSSAAVAPTVRKPQQGPRLGTNSHHQVHNVCLPPTTAEMELNGKQLLQHTHGFVPCRKHPNAAEAYVNSDLERRWNIFAPLPMYICLATDQLTDSYIH